MPSLRMTAMDPHRMAMVRPMGRMDPMGRTGPTGPTDPTDPEPEARAGPVVLGTRS